MSTEVSKCITDGRLPNKGSKIIANNEEIDLRELFSVILQGKWSIMVITALFAISSVFFALMQPNIYRSEALLAPSSEAQGGGLGEFASQFGGLASIAGVNLGGKGGINKTQMAIEVMKSRKFATEFIQKHNLLADLMAADKWDVNQNKLIYNPTLYNDKTNTWVREMKAPFKPKPSMQEAFNVFTKAVAVNLAKDSGMVTVSVEHVSPSVAQQWVTWLVQDINTMMKDRDVAEANSSTQFLNKQIALTNIADIKTILYKLIEQQAKTIMLAEVRDEYIFKTIDPAIIPEVKAKPKRALICILGTIFGFMLGLIIVLVRYYVKDK